jgi:leucyl/phenylalanyl-tRNA---protein transferase
MCFELTPELILRAYSTGVFPMGGEDGEIRWYSPDPRCIFDLKQFHVAKRLARKCRQGIFDIRVNSAWDEVMAHCAERPSTWINADIVRAYTALHKMGFAHSVEAYCDGNLVGGLYGVALRGAFMGESMFHTVTDASKICLVFLVERLCERGFVLLDCQFMTRHLFALGALSIPRAKYIELLGDALKLKCRFD